MNWLSAAAGAILTALVGYGLHSLDVDRINAKHEKAMTAQAESLNKQCADQQAITERVSNDYQNKVADLGKRLDAARRLYSGNACLTVTGHAASGYDDAAAANKPAGQGAGRNSTIDINKYIDFAAEGEKYRLQLLACQSYVNLTDPRQKGQKQPK